MSEPVLRFSAESRPNSSIAVHRGPLHYAYDIPRSQTTLATNAQQSMAVDLEYDATGTWQYAIDPSTLAFSNDAHDGESLPSPIFDSSLPPLKISVTACTIDWALAGDTYPVDPPANPSCTGSSTTINLWPYGVSLVLR